MAGINPLTWILRGSQVKNDKDGKKSGVKRSTPPQSVVNHITVRPIQRGTVDIQEWRSAIRYAEGEHDQRWKLYELYTDLLLDGFTYRQMEKRIEAITNIDLTFTVDGVNVPEIEDLQLKGFFHRFMREAIATKFWGHSLMELYWPRAGSDDPGETCLVHRSHVKPRLGIVAKEKSEVTGIQYRERPWRDVIIEIGDPDDLGILMQVSQYVIYKRGNFGDWAEFAEVFGMPFRWAKYNNEHSREILEKALAEAGSAGYVVAPQDAELEFFNGTAGGQSNDVFRFLRNACNEEISITILGNSMTTTEAAKSGYAQAEIHQNTQDEVHRADRRFLLRILNEKLTPYLERLGYPVKGGHWSYEEEDGLSLTDRLTVDLKVSEKVPVPDDYWYDKYKIPKPSGAQVKKKILTTPSGDSSD